MSNYSPFEIDMITHGVEKCKTAIGDVTRFSSTGVETMSITFGVSEALFCASVTVMLSMIPPEEHNRVLNDLLKETYHKIKLTHKSTIDSTKPPI